MGSFFGGPSAPAPPPPPPAPPRMADSGIKDTAAAQRAAAAAADGSGFNDTIGSSGIQGVKTPTSTGGKALLGQ